MTEIDTRLSRLKKLLGNVMNYLDQKYKIEAKLLEEVENFFLYDEEEDGNDLQFLPKLLMIFDNNLRDAYIVERYLYELGEYWFQVRDYSTSVLILDNLYRFLDDAGLRGFVVEKKDE